MMGPGTEAIHDPICLPHMLQRFPYRTSLLACGFALAGICFSALTLTGPLAASLLTVGTEIVPVVQSGMEGPTDEAPIAPVVEDAPDLTMAGAEFSSFSLSGSGANALLPDREWPHDLPHTALCRCDFQFVPDPPRDGPGKPPKLSN